MHKEIRRPALDGSPLTRQYRWPLGWVGHSWKGDRARTGLMVQAPRSGGKTPSIIWNPSDRFRLQIICQEQVPEDTAPPRSGRDDSVFVIQWFDQRLVQFHNGLLVLALFNHKLHIHLTQALVNGQYADVLVR